MNNLRLNVPNVRDVTSKKKISIGLNIRRLSTDVNGTIVADNLLPASMQTNYPFHLFGEFDRASGYAIADKAMRDKNGTKLFSVYVWGVNSPLFFFNPLADINKFFQKGDIIFVYVDDLIAPTTFSFVFINSLDGNYASISAMTVTNQLDSNNWGAFKIGEIHEGWVDDSQLDQLWFFINTKFDGRFLTDNKSPYDYFNPEINVQNKIVISYESVVNQFLGLSSFIAFQNNLLTVSLIIYV